MRSPRPPTSSPASRVGVLGGLALLAVAVAAAYANSLHVPFQFDDRVVILGEPSITGFHPLIASRRFLGDLSFAISYRLSGDRPLGYHLLNGAIHLANTWLVFWLVLSLLRAARRGAAAAPGDETVALVTGLLFAVHPLQTQAVTYVAQRYASLAATFFLLACVSWVRFRGASGRRAAAWYAAALAAGAAAAWTKENTLILPLVLLGIELAWFSASPGRRLLFFAPFLLAAGFAIALGVRSGWTLAGLDAALRLDTDAARADYALTQLRVVASYLRLLVLPVGQNIDHDVGLSRSVLEPRVLLAAALHAGLVAAAVAAIVRGRRREAPLWTLAGVGVLWFYATLLVESSFIPIVDPMYEHRVYLPSAGALWAVAALLASVPAHSGRRALLAAGVALALPLTAFTIARNRVWQSDLSLWTDAAAKSPHKARALNNVGCALFARGDARGALDWYRRALDADPGYVKAWFNAGEALQRLGDCRAAVPAYERFLAAEPSYPETYLNLAACYDLLGRGDLGARLRAAHAELARRQAGAPLPTSLR